MHLTSKTIEIYLDKHGKLLHIFYLKHPQNSIPCEKLLLSIGPLESVKPQCTSSNIEFAGLSDFPFLYFDFSSCKYLATFFL